ncbi:hypothetical protein T492DRAFT_849153 [Pavlovales sp. CCMP2436]|nr:hypothetical protein T492DRAFT_849153 [Pavlovales sp. CCMP2436]
MAAGLAIVPLCPGVTRAAIEQAAGAGEAGWDELHKLAHRGIGSSRDGLRPFKLLRPALAPSPLGVIPRPPAAEKAPSSDAPAAAPVAAPAAAAGGLLADFAAEGAGDCALARAFLWPNDVLRDPSCALELDGRGTRLVRRAKGEVAKRGCAPHRCEPHSSVALWPGRERARLTGLSGELSAANKRIKQLVARVKALMERDAVHFDADDRQDAADLAELAQIVVDADEMSEEEHLREALKAPMRYDDRASSLRAPLSAAALGSWQLPIASPRAPVVPPDPSTTVRPDLLLSLHKACFTEQLRRHRVALPAELANKVPVRGTVKYAPLIDRLRDLGVAPAY